MGKLRKAASGEKREVHPLVSALTGEIVREAEKRLTREELGKRARRNPSILYGWRNGNRKSPSLLVLQDFARAVGLTLTLSDSTGSQVGPCRRFHVGSEFERHLLAVVRALTTDQDRSDLLTIVSDFVLARTSGSHPLEPAAASK